MQHVSGIKRMDSVTVTKGMKQRVMKKVTSNKTVQLASLLKLVSFFCADNLNQQGG